MAWRYLCRDQYLWAQFAYHSGCWEWWRRCKAQVPWPRREAWEGQTTWQQQRAAMFRDGIARKRCRWSRNDGLDWRSEVVAEKIYVFWDKHTSCTSDAHMHTIAQVLLTAIQHSLRVMTRNEMKCAYKNVLSEHWRFCGSATGTWDRSSDDLLEKQFDVADEKVTARPKFIIVTDISSIVVADDDWMCQLNDQW